jgi:PIN domain nuclease of toxin-antitoxin system
LRFLLDTHILLWALAEPEKLSKNAVAMMADPANVSMSSAIAVWEITIKHGRNRGKPGDMPISGAQAITLAEMAAIELLDVSPGHTAHVATLEPHHRDPFDRLLIAQAHFEDLILLTHDKQLAAYGDYVMLV